MFFEKVFRKLNEHRVKYLVIGGAAVNFHGFIRVTNDLDLMILLDKENVNRFSKAANELGYIPRVPVKIEDIADINKREEWIKEKNMKVFSIINPNQDEEIVDIMVMDYIDFNEAYKNKKAISVNGEEIQIISIKDLIKLKEILGRPQDILDIKMLLKIWDRNK